MPEAHYDAVVLGGGHHATIIACYLARTGLSVGVFERSASPRRGCEHERGACAGVPDEPLLALDPLLRPSGLP